MSSRRGIILAYRQFKNDSGGWGVPRFEDFRARLWPLRTQADKARWSDEDMVFVLELQEDGAGYALQRFFTVRGRANPVAVEIFGEAPLAREAMTRDNLDTYLHTFVRDCITGSWTQNTILAYIAYLDSDKVPGDFEGAPENEADGGLRDLFAEAYRKAGKGYQRRVREALGAAADK